MIDYGYISENIQIVRGKIAEAAERVERSPDDVTLIAVTKTHPAEMVAAAAHAGVIDAGENRIQEALPKINAISNDLNLSQVQWHLIGHLQSNKAKLAAENFDMIHSVDSLKLAQEISKHAKNADRMIPVLLQINISGEDSKNGMPPEDTESIANQILESCPHLVIRGFMTIAPLDGIEKARPTFKGLRELSIDIRSRIKHGRFDAQELSMGMSGDFEIAIEEGSTMVRVGSAIFGNRG